MGDITNISYLTDISSVAARTVTFVSTGPRIVM